MFHSGVLGAEDRAVVVHHDGDLELVFFEGDNQHFDAISSAVTDVLSDFEETSVGFLLGAAGFLDLGHERQRRSIQNGNLRAVEFEYGVVNA